VHQVVGFEPMTSANVLSILVPSAIDEKTHNISVFIVEEIGCYIVRGKSGLYSIILLSIAASAGLELKRHWLLSPFCRVAKLQ
jgi:hypothetical protein